MTIGKAMAEAKKDYVFGFGGNDSLDRKTVTEFNIYGVPWTFIYYPGGGTAQQGQPQRVAPTVLEERAFTTLSGSPERVGATAAYSRTFEVDIASYQVATETMDSIAYHILTVEGGGLALEDGYPILPYIEGYTMTLPFSGTVTGVQVVNVVTSPEGLYNIPIAEVGPWSEEGLTYTTTTDIDYPYPPDADLVQYQETGGGMLFTLFPIQHNPTTDETTFYSHFEVRVTYDSPLAVAVTDFTTDRDRYTPGDTISTTTLIENVGDVDATLRGVLIIEDDMGQVMGTEISTLFTVPSDGSYTLDLACAWEETKGTALWSRGGTEPRGWSWTTGSGSYRATITLLQGGAVVAGASADIVVLGGEITSLAVPDTLFLGQEGTFEITFANYRSDTVSAEVSLIIQDSGGGFVEEIAPQIISVPGGSTETAAFNWTPQGVSSGSYMAMATVTVEDEVYGPTMQRFEVEQNLCYLPSVVKNVRLGEAYNLYLPIIVKGYSGS